MEVEFSYNNTTSNQIVSPLKPISYLKKLACQCFSLNKDSIQLFYNNKLISQKLENNYIKDYFVKDLIIKIKVKGTSIQLNTFNSNSYSILTSNKESNEREKRIKGIKLNLKELDKKIKLIYNNNTNEIKNFYSDRGFFSNYNQQVQIHKKNNINRTISFDIKSKSNSNINNNSNLNNFNKNNKILNNEKIKEKIKEKFHIPLIQKKTLSPSNKDNQKINSILNSKIPIFSSLNPFELNKNHIRYIAHKNLKTRNFINNFDNVSNTEEISSNFLFEKCQECNKKNILYYCRNDNKFICSKCQIINHLNHNLIIIEGGNITQAGYKYQKILINEINELENQTQKLLLKDEEDTTELITNEIKSIKKNVINLAKTGQLILDIYPDNDILETISDNSIFYKEKVKIYSLITMRRLAQELWNENVRESRLLAILLTPGGEFLPEVADIWAQEFRTTEEASLMSMELIYPQKWATSFAFEQIARGNYLPSLCGWLTICRLLREGGKLMERSEQELRDHAASIGADAPLPLRKAVQATIQYLSD